MDNETRSRLRHTSNEGLLQALLILTHKVHAADATADEASLPNPMLPGVSRGNAHRAADEWREQRDLVRDEIMRRMQYGYKGPNG